MRELLSLFGRAFDDAETYCGHQPDDGYIEKLLGGETFVAIAAFAGEKMVGGLAGYVLPKFEQLRSEFYIYDLAVAESHRRQGVATAMIGKVKEVATSRGFTSYSSRRTWKTRLPSRCTRRLGIAKTWCISTSNHGEVAMRLVRPTEAHLASYVALFTRYAGGADDRSQQR